MFNALASLAQRRGVVVVITSVILFGIAGALGSSVASRLDPYGNDDPKTESVIAADRLEAAGYRDASVVVLIEGTRVQSASGRSKVEALTRQLRDNPDVAGVHGYLDTRSPDFLSQKGDATYLAVSLRP